MVDWRDLYRQKRVTLEQAAALVRGGDIITTGHGSTYPRALMNAIIATGTRDLTVAHSYVGGRLEYLEPENRDRFFHHALMIGPTSRDAYLAGKADYEPSFFYSHAATPVQRTGPYTNDVVILNLAPPDDDGNMSYGVCCSYLPLSVSASRTVIAQVNAEMPFTFGESIHVSRVDHLVEVASPIVALAARAAKASEAGQGASTDGPTEVERRIGSLVAERVEDGATIQIGLGTIPDAILSQLEGKRDLGVHTEMMSDGLLNLVEKGVITNARKTLHPGRIVATFLMGSERLYKWAHRNPMLEMRGGEYTNDPCVISRNYRLVSVNTALQVDLTGQINAESIGPVQYSGTGGHLDFAYAALKTPGGKSFIAIPSTAGGGKYSRIVAAFEPGTVVTTPRTMTDYVVTEHGCVQLKGKTTRERARALIGIADPAFRDQLTAKAATMGYLL